MRREETLKVLSILKVAYPNFYKNITRQEAEAATNLWYLQFRDIPVDIVEMAVEKLISTSKFPPSIAEVKQKLKDMYCEALEVNLTLKSDTGNAYKRIMEVCSNVEPEPSISVLLYERRKSLEAHGKCEISLPTLPT